MSTCPPSREAPWAGSWLRSVAVTGDALRVAAMTGRWRSGALRSCAPRVRHGASRCAHNTCTESGGGTTKASEEGSFIFADVSFETSADYDTYQYQGENVAPAINGMMNPARWGGVDADGTTDTDIYPSSVFTCDEAETDGFSDAYAPSSKYRGTYVFEAAPGLKSVFLPAPSGRNGWEWMVPGLQ